ncbi:MAG: molybdenum cofactor guanylyltransferase MobA [Pseudomonadota bacterium]
MSANEFPAVILAGGLARRMGGGDKALLEVGGRPILDHVVDRLRPQARPLALNANGDPARFVRYGLPVIADTVADRPGPLAGVLAGLEWAAAEGFDGLVTVAADTPFFPKNLVEQLRAVRSQNPIALAATPHPEGGELRHPTFGLWATDLRGDLRRAIDEGTRKIVAWADHHGAASAMFATEPFDPFFNINTPQDRDRAEALLAHAP